MGLSVVIAGGGTGGHIEPALALADALRRADPDTAVTCLGTERGLETRLVPMRGYDLALIPPVPLPRSLTPALFSVPGRLAAAVGAAAAVLDRVQADVLVGFGGYVATPGYLAARRRGVPIVVHEANSRPGLANRIGALLTRDVCTGQRGTRLRHARFVGIPIRQEISGLDRLALSEKARAHFGLQPDLPVLLVTGGSQGAASLNRAVLGAAAAIRAAGVQVLHIAGPKAGELTVPPGPAPYVVLPYLDRMDLGYAAADFALCRAGAMTCAELAAIGLPAVYVPLPHGNGEQRLNALPIEAVGGGKIVPDDELTPDWLATELIPILLDGELVAAMSRAAASAGNPNADAELAAIVLAAGRTTRSARSRRSAGGHGSGGHGSGGHGSGGDGSRGHGSGSHRAGQQTQQTQQTQGEPGGQEWA
jgi:UDP-N-acetylglucosamine--N-acetylmuramyl-(pentapeptide) pyrophosphoryl-undecaprenol N-acetylglucosamine transferase